MTACMPSKRRNRTRQHQEVARGQSRQDHSQKRLHILAVGSKRTLETQERRKWQGRRTLRWASCSERPLSGENTPASIITIEPPRPTRQAARHIYQDAAELQQASVIHGNALLATHEPTVSRRDEPMQSSAWRGSSSACGAQKKEGAARPSDQTLLGLSHVDTPVLEL